MTIKRCPFCDGHDCVLTIGEDVTGVNDSRERRGMPVAEWAVICKHCGAMGPLSSQQNAAVQAWNEAERLATPLPKALVCSCGTKQNPVIGTLPSEGSFVRCEDCGSEIQEEGSIIDAILSWNAEIREDYQAPPS